MSRPLFVWVEGGKLHRNPAYEDCNLDDATVTNRYKAIQDVPRRALKSPCSKCDPLGDLPPMTQEFIKSPDFDANAEDNGADAPPTETPEGQEVKASGKDQ